MVGIVARDDDAPTGPAGDDRLVWERVVRVYIRLIFRAVLHDRWGWAWTLWQEARQQGEWFAVGVWAGLPNTVRERLRQIEQETNDANRGAE